ncbi:uncharacterized protein LOC114527367 [Dendronephthya gigantea]|uniref:uncharacterized protein LOC114527367 n=1 Tax=Dendronephthya gigantea TaxID=151771 RepID=UPI00106C2A87|nr:uncharacterized protein LOC114527367 [Dendronephthya gigantea]
MIIGCDVPEAHWVLDQRRGRRKEPYAVKTLLGWTLMGPARTEEPEKFHVHFINREDNNLQDQLERMFQMEFSETDAISTTEMSMEDRKALSIMESSAKLVNGHYQIALPWRYGIPNLPNNRSMAEQRMKSLQWRLKKNPKLKEKYKNVIEDYVEKGFASKVIEEPAKQLQKNESSSIGRVWYLPHHPVFHPQKPGKVRVVFDCAAKYKNTSLNDQLLQGPDFTNKLIGVLIRFRLERIALTSDVEAMFHQVRVDPKDCDTLRFLWWPDADFAKPLEEYQMQVHLFGATSSPSCAAFALRKTAQDHGAEFDKETVNTVNKNFYVDDCLKSVPTVNKAVSLVSELTTLLAKGGFHLTKWMSNSREVLASIPQKERVASVVNLDFESLPVEHALGVLWDVEDDVFRFRIAEMKEIKTRRGILSLVSSMYDPMGFASPFVLPAKQVLQRLCQAKYGWDEVLPEDEIELWRNWQESITQLKTMTIPRCIRQDMSANLCRAEVHNFADASRDGYGAASYLRQVDEEGKVIVSLIVAKSRVTPSKPVTIPRLELTAAVLAVKLNRQVEEELEIPISRVVFWTDSTVVLQYINNESKRFQTFVANRLAVIHDMSTPSMWRYVDTKSNPADYASRGLKADEQRKIHVWLNGPNFLREEEDKWPEMPEGLKEMPDEQLEWRKTAQVHEIVTSKDGTAFDRFLEYYSSWYALQKGVAWFLRYLSFLRSTKKSPDKVKDGIAKGHLTVNEIRVVTDKIVRYVQRQNFSEEIETLQTAETKSDRTRNLLKRSNLRKLSPVLLNGILRVGGRLERFIII